ncbi:Phosphatidate phosphatase PAH1 [Quillaja saponaria]|uniref:phosphatidate phosphatase n=1 Tax=Quillaja saponaria TaxID=32244 RepID=A0AAD7Q0E0_QUISA|nr:Phosphatidate phosphatase PAH1 [Quillaja saponaria]
MNVVGKVGSLITQGVYSVATPFHPFGGAIDVIVVQQQDGTFRSTPWYVRFGKFQGVLKGAEKIVRINVNGVEANFHMYLANSGEAYFVEEVNDNKGPESNGVAEATNISEVIQKDSIVEADNKNYSNGLVIDTCRLEHSVSDSGVFHLKDEGETSTAFRIERAQSDGHHRIYKFEDEQSLEGSVELSEYGSNRYESLDGENFADPQGSDSEVILFSVDGHVLTAPISASEQNPVNVQLSTPQFHLGPGEGTDFCEGNEEFGSGEDVWPADYIGKLDSSTATVASNTSCSTNNDDSAFGNNLEACDGEEKRVSLAQESLLIVNQEGDLHMQADSGDALSRIKTEEDFKSCLELQQFVKQVGNNDLQGESSLDCPIVDENKHGGFLQFRNTDEVYPSAGSGSHGGNRSLDQPIDIREAGENVLRAEILGPRRYSVTNDTEWTDENFGKSSKVEGVVESQERSAFEDDCSKRELSESRPETSNEREQTYSSLRFEISLCGHELRAGIGLGAAAEAFEAHRISAEEFKSAATSIIKNPNLIVKFREKYLLWEKAAPLVLGMATFGLDLPVNPKDVIPVEQDNTLKSTDDDPGTTPTSSGRRWRLWPNPFRRVRTLEHTSSNSSNEEIFVDSESDLQNSFVEPTPASGSSLGSPHKQFIRTNVPTNEQIESLNLKEGQNLVTFSFSTRVLGMQQVDAHIYLWKWNARIVISDVDGTITKSDVLGQFMPLVGKDWTQSGVARLFSAIKENGYQLLFLSARAIVQAYLTRSFLLNLKQDGKALPSGPVVISPDGLFPSLYREVIRRAPHEFKIACLEDIKRLFPSDYNPFYAGFGNRDTDELSYRKIGIPKGKIFIINPKGEVANSHRIDVKSYTSLHTLVNDMFPPTSLVEQEDYNSWNYWKMPFPDIDN